jgi:hypothetical protein
MYLNQPTAFDGEVELHCVVLGELVAVDESLVEVEEDCLEFWVLFEEFELLGGC